MARQPLIISLNIVTLKLLFNQLGSNIRVYKKTSPEEAFMVMRFAWIFHFKYAEKVNFDIW